MAWRNCQASLTLVAAINAKYPGRDKASDGTIGDAAHATRTSDHNPWVIVAGMGVVRARDVDKDGIDAAWIVEELRKLGAAGDVRLRNKGYIIFNGRITSPDFSRWNVYTGSNKHTQHFHVSFSVDQAGFDSSAPWAFLGGGAPVTDVPAPPPSGGVTWEPRVNAALGARVLYVGRIGSDVGFVQRYLGLKDDDEFGKGTEERVKWYQGQRGLGVDGRIGPQTWAAMGIKTGAPVAPAPVPPPPPAFNPDGMRSLAYGMRNDADVKEVQAFLNRYNWSPALPLLPVTGNYLDQTVKVVKAAQAQCGIKSDGKDIGPLTKRAFAARGARW